MNVVDVSFNDQKNFASFDIKKTEIESDESLSGFGFKGLNTGSFFEL